MRQTIRIPALLLILALLVSLCAPAALAAGDAPDVSWYRDSGTEFTLTTAAQLAGLSQLVADGTDFSGKTIRLGCSVDLSAFDPWQPIGAATITETSSGARWTVGTAFAGTFDGQGHTISGLHAQSEQGGVALFGCSTGTLQDFTVSGSVSGCNLTAGIVAYAGGTLQGLTNAVQVTAAGNCVGGVAADALGALQITDCRNEAEITSGGVASERSTGRIAGILGRADTGKTVEITNCSNTAPITGYQYVAGILGGGFGNVTLSACFNTGTLTAVSFGKVYLGGIVGKLENGTVDSCYNTGAIQDHPWSAGHIRAVGGIAGCEAGHTEGVAISHCYNAGPIELDTSHMRAGTNYIYMTGNISGGNNTTEASTMQYTGCFYLAGSLAIQNPAHPSYSLWCDVYRDNPLAYDTEYITACTEQELKSEAVLSQLGSLFCANPDGGYPVLYWQCSAPKPPAEDHPIRTQISGGDAAIACQQTARAGETVPFQLTLRDADKQVKLVQVLDASGALVEVTGSGTDYQFVMPPRSVTICVTLENRVEDDASYYAVALPEGLDPIWSLRLDATHQKDGKIAAGSTVTLCVSKEKGAATTSFDGVTLTCADGTPVETQEDNLRVSAGANYYAEYTFTMPQSDVTAALNETYVPLTVTRQKDGTEQTLATLSRAQLLELAKANERICFSGWSTETIPFLGAAEQYVTLAQLLTLTGCGFGPGDSLRVTGADGFSISYSYEYLFGQPRACYSDILQNGVNADQATPLAPMFTIRANTTFDPQTDPASLTCDTLNAYRFVFGQSEQELTGAVKIVDSMPKGVIRLCIQTHTHAYAETARTEPTEQAAGSVTYTCALCQDSYTEPLAQRACPSAAYADVPAYGNWAHAGIDYCVENGLMNGMSADRFDPKGTLTRAQLVTILYRVAGQPDVTTSGSFTDLTANWYKNAVEWAAANGIVKGYPDGTFRPNDPITREQIAAILYRFHAAAPAGTDRLSAFPDALDVSGWAAEGMNWAVNEGLINGVAVQGTSFLQPKATATRAQIAAMIQRDLSR